MLDINIKLNNSNDLELVFETEELTLLLDIIEYHKCHCSDDNQNVLVSLEHKLKALCFLDKQPDAHSIRQIKDVLFPSNEISRNNAFNVKISELNFSKRTFNCLNRANIKTLSDLLYMTEEDLLRIRNLGTQCLDEIVGVLKNHNLELTKFHNK